MTKYITNFLLLSLCLSVTSIIADVKESEPNTGGSDSIIGDWEGVVRYESSDLRILWRFEESTDDVLVGRMDRYSLGVAKTEMQNLDFSGSALSFSLDGGYSFSGWVVGDSAVGSWIDDGRAVPVSMEKKHIPPLAQEAKEKLLGTWSGKAHGYTLAFHFEQNEAFLATVDATRFFVLGSTGMLIIDLVLENGRVSMKVPRIEAEFEGVLEGDEIRGQLTFEDETSPLTITRSSVL